MWILVVLFLIWLLIPTPVVVTVVEIKETKSTSWPPWQPIYEGDRHEERECREGESSGPPWS